MPVATVLEFPGVTQERYERMNAELSRQDPPTGILIHIYEPIVGGWRIADVWQSREAFVLFGRTAAARRRDRLPRADLAPPGRPLRRPRYGQSLRGAGSAFAHRPAHPAGRDPPGSEAARR